MKVEIWSDVVCPWCYIGKRHFEQALASFAHAGQVEVEWKSYELQPEAPREPQPGGPARLAAKYGIPLAQAEAMEARVTSMAAAAGLDYRLDRARPGNTVDAHRLIHLAAEQGLQDAVKERLLRAYFTEGEPISDHRTLVRLVAEAGVDAGQARAVLDSDRYLDAVRADEAEARALGITGVPFFVLDRSYGVSGAQPPDLLLSALEQAWSESHPVTMVAGGEAGAACTDESCAL